MRMDRRSSASGFLIVLAPVLAITGTWHNEVCETGPAQPALAQATKTTLSITTQNQLSPITPSPLTAASSAKAIGAEWKTHVVQTWKWAYQIRIPKGWYVIDYANEN